MLIISRHARRGSHFDDGPGLCQSTAAAPFSNAAFCLFIFIHPGTRWGTASLKIQAFYLKISTTLALPLPRIPPPFLHPPTLPQYKVSAASEGKEGNRARGRTLKGQTSWYPCSRAELQRACPAKRPPPCHTRWVTDAVASSLSLQRLSKHLSSVPTLACPLCRECHSSTRKQATLPFPDLKW